MVKLTKKEEQKAQDIYKEIVKMEGVVFVFRGLFGDDTVMVPAGPIYQHILRCVAKARKKKHA